MQPASQQSTQHPLNSLVTQFVLFVFFAIFVTAAMLSWISIRSAQQQRLGEVRTIQPRLLEAATRSIDEWLDLRLIELNAAAWAPGAETRSADALLATLEHFDALVILDRQGLPRTASGYAAQLEEALTASRDIMTTHLGTLASADAEASVVALAPLRRSGADPDPDSGGYLVGSIHPLHLGRLLERQADSWPGTVVPRLQLLTLEGVPVRGGRTGAGALDTEQGRDRERDGAPNLSSEIASYTDRTRRQVLGSGHPLDSLSLIVVQETDYEDIFAPVRRLSAKIIAFDLAILLVFSFAAQRVGRRIMRPIASLSEGAQRIAEGQIDHEIPDPRSDNEMGLLTRTFNTMMARLRANQLQIEETNEKLRMRNEELQSANEVLAQLSITDGLTRLHNHRYFQDQLSREIRLHTRTRAPLSMLLIDLDDFKKLNDRYGHAIGDETLVGVAGVLNDTVRSSDLLARYGGEEFVILAPHTNLEGGVRLAEKLRLAIEQERFDSAAKGDAPVDVTVSIGVAQFRDDRRRFFDAADRALYRAKAMGKNCVIAESEPND